MGNENLEQNENDVQIEKPLVEFKPKKDLKKLIKDIIYYACIVAIVCIIIYMYVGSRPIKADDVACVYKEKQDKIVCTQTGEIVPKWLDINPNNYSMLLIFAKDKDNYVALKMKDGVFIPNMNRKLVYEKEEQTLTDYIRFKSFVKANTRTNWGATILYCSDSNASVHDVCKEIKKNHKD